MMKKPSFLKRATGKSVVVVVVQESAKKEEWRPADYSSIRELNEGTKRRDVDKWYEGYLGVKYITHSHLECVSARHPVALETYLLLSDCEAMICEAYGELEIEAIQTQMTQKPMLRSDVYAHAMRASQNRK